METLPCEGVVRGCQKTSPGSDSESWDVGHDDEEHVLYMRIENEGLRSSQSSVFLSSLLDLDAAATMQVIIIGLFRECVWELFCLEVDCFNSRLDDRLMSPGRLHTRNLPCAVRSEVPQKETSR